MTYQEFMCIYQHGDLEDKIDEFLLWMYNNNYRCKDISLNLLHEHNLFADFPTNDIPDAYAEIKSIIYSYYRQFCRELNKPNYFVEIYAIDDLYKINDSSYHNTSLKFSIDDPYRDYPFIIYNNDFLNQDGKYKTHKEILEQTFNVQVISTNVRELDAIINLPYKPIIFGSIKDDICIVDAYEKCTEEETANIIHKLNFKYSFYFDFIHNRIKKI